MNDSTGDRVRSALASLKGGRAQEAVDGLVQVLERDENHFDALQLLGVAHLELGRCAEAVPFLRRALAVRDGSGVVHDNLGTALRLSGDVEAAIEHHRRAIDLEPGIAGYHNNLGIALRRAGRLEEAESAYRAALDLDPASANAAFNRGNVLRELGRLEESVRAYREALERRPDYVDAHYNLGCVEAQRRDLPAAVRAFEKVLEIAPEHALAPARLGAFLVELGRFEDAGRWLARAVELNPTDPDVHCNLGALEQAMGDPEAAIVSCQRAIQIDPGHADGAWNLSLPLLLTGRLREGWHFYEHRPGVRSRGPVLMVGDVPVKRWRGEPLAGRRILLIPEQGLGDQIQCLRFVPELQRRGAIVDLVVSPELSRIAQSVRGAASVGIRPRESGPHPDAWNFLMSVPAMLGTTLESIPGETYLTPPPDLERRWADRLAGAAGGGPRVGLVWAGSPKHRNDRNRSISPAMLAPLAGVEGVTWVNLQKGADPTVLEGVLGAGRVLSFLDQMVDMAETAALIRNLDLVIAVDTSVAHLAGAMGRPVWTMLPAVPDWRWLLDRTDTPWYPSMRLFRQDRPGDWAGVIERVRVDLSEKGPAKRPRPAKVQDGIKQLQAGKMADAVRLLGEALAEDPDSVDANHYQGVALLCLGRNAEGVARIEHAVRLQPSDPAAQQNLANGYRALGRIADALAGYGRAIALKSDYREAVENRANLLKDQDRHEEAERDYRRILELAPDRAGAWEGLGCVLAAQGRPGDAIEAFQQALDRRPGDEDALAGLGRALQAQGKADEAVKVYEEAHRRQPGSPRILNHLGNALRALKRYGKALEAYRLALSLKPDSASVLCNLSALHASMKNYAEGIDAAHQALALAPGRVEAMNNLANNLQGLDRFEEAEKVYLEGLEKDPGMAEMWNNLGLVKFQMGRIAEAHAYFDRAMAQKDSYHDAMWNKSLGYLLEGRFAEGWSLYESRFAPNRRDRIKAPDVKGCARWVGEDLAGKKLLLVREQGLGDQIQFLRYVPVLARLGVTVDVVLAPELAALARTVEGVREVLPKLPEDASGYDRWAMVMSAPYGLRERHPAIPTDVPYVTADPGRVAHWKARLSELCGEGIRIGLVWAGNPDHPMDRLRSMGLGELVPLLERTDVTFVSLQKGPRATTEGTQGAERVVSLDPELTSFAETAAVLENLDLTICVDTSVAHLAGALGRPVWVLVAKAPDWRWGLGGETSAWYPTMRLFRQDTWADWASVVQGLKRELARFVALAQSSSTSN